MPNRSLQTLPVLAWIAAAVPAQQPDGKGVPALHPEVLPQVRMDLASYYEDGVVPDYKKAVQALASDNPRLRTWGGRYLHAVLAQFQLDQAAGRVPYEEPSGGGDKPGVAYDRFKTTIAWDLKRARLHEGGVEALPVALWMLHEGRARYDSLDDHGVDILRRIRAPQADAQLVQILTVPHPKFEVLVTAIRSAAARRLEAARAPLLRLCQHYHETVRKTARYEAWKWDLEVPDFDLAQAMSASLVGWLARFDRIMKLHAPAGKDLRAYELVGEFWGAGTKGYGWVVPEPGGHVRVFGLDGSVFTVEDKQIRHEAADAAALARQFLAMREKFNGTEDFEVRRGLEAEVGIRRFSSSSSSRWVGSVPEVILAAWAVRDGDKTTAADLLLPTLSDSDSEDGFFQEHLQRLAAALDGQMLGAFTGHDYDEALRLARHLAGKDFEGWYHQDRAIALVEQLPRRSADFKTLQLPTPDEWKTLQPTLSRSAQLRYLAERFRLLQCEQLSNPGAISYSQEQFRRPQQKGGKPVPCVNPFDAILALNPTAADLVHLLPELQSKDFILGYDLQRFLPQGPQNLHRVSWVAASILNHVAQQDLVGDAMSTDPAVRTRELARIEAWCKEHGSATLADRLAARLEDTKTEWDGANRPFWQLFEVDPGRAAASLLARAAREPQRLPDVIRILALTGRHEFAEKAKAWSKDQALDEETRFFAALIELQSSGGKREEGLDQVLARLGKGDMEATHAALEVLARGEHPRIRAFVDTLLSDRPPEWFRPTLPLLQELARHGHARALQRVGDLLAGKGDYPCWDGIGEDAKREKDPLSIAMSVHFSWMPAAAQADQPVWEMDDKGKQKLAVRVQDWVKAQAARVAAGETPQIGPPTYELPWRGWRTFSTGWIRRF